MYMGKISGPKIVEPTKKFSIPMKHVGLTLSFEHVPTNHLQIKK